VSGRATSLLLALLSPLLVAADKPVLVPDVSARAYGRHAYRPLWGSTFPTKHPLHLSFCSSPQVKKLLFSTKFFYPNATDTKKELATA
jgi:hypothetical protein